jgi:hypothetical protein
MTILATTPTFNITGYPPDSPSIRTTSNGYSVILRVGMTIGLVDRTFPVRIGNITLSMKWTFVSSNTAVFAFTLRNDGSLTTADIGVSNDAYFDATDNPPIATIGDGQAFAVYGERGVITFIVRSAPFVSDVSTYWFGVVSSLSMSNWTQVTADSIANIDSTWTLSWQNITVPTKGIITRSFLVTFGILNADQITLNMDIPAINGSIYYRDSLEISGEISSSKLDDILQILIVIDNDPSQIIPTDISFPSGAEFLFEFRPIDYAIPEGGHNVSFYAVNREGSISNAQIVFLAVIEPSPSPKKTETASGSVLPKATEIQFNTSVLVTGSDEPPETKSGIIGPVIGGAVGFLVIVTVLVIYFIWRKRTRQTFHKLSFGSQDQGLEDDLMSTEHTEKLI